MTKNIELTLEEVIHLEVTLNSQINECNKLLESIALEEEYAQREMTIQFLKREKNTAESIIEKIKLY